MLIVVSDGKKPFTLRDFQGWELSDVQEWLGSTAWCWAR